MLIVAAPLVKLNAPKSPPVICGGNGLNVLGTKSQPMPITPPPEIVEKELPVNVAVIIDEPGVPLNVIVN